VSAPRVSRARGAGLNSWSGQGATARERFRRPLRDKGGPGAHPLYSRSGKRTIFPATVCHGLPNPVVAPLCGRASLLYRYVVTTRLWRCPGGGEASTRRLGGEAKSGRVRGQKEESCWSNERFWGGLWALSWGRSRGRDGREEPARTGEKVRRNERRREVILSASRVNCWVGKSAPDRKAPRTEPSSVRLVM
jgi:hypothetical protein